MTHEFFIVYRGNGNSYLNAKGTWTHKRENARAFASEQEAWDATRQFTTYGCGVEVVRAPK